MVIGIGGTTSGTETVGTISGTGEAIEGAGAVGTKRHHDGGITERTTAGGTGVGATGRE